MNKEELSRAHEHLPVVENGGEIFKEHPRAQYYISLCALNGAQIEPDIFLAARQLRANKYMDLGWLSEQSRDSDGGEHDNDDLRSAEFAIVSNDDDAARVIATQRLIMKDSEMEEPLPVERFFPEIHVAAGEGEYSRLISDSKDKRERSLASLACYRTACHFMNNRDYKGGYATVEDYLFRVLNKAKVPFTQETDFVSIDEYAGTKNAAIGLNMEEINKNFKLTNFKSPASMAAKVFFNSNKSDDALGFYSSNLIHRIGKRKDRPCAK